MRTWQRVSNWAGIVAAPLLAAAIVAVTLSERAFLADAGWDPVRRTRVGWPSVLALSDSGAIVVAAFVVCALLGLVFAGGLYGAVSTAAAKLGAAALVALALLLLLEALRADAPWSLQRTWHGRIHDAAYPFLVVAALVASVALALGLWREDRGQARAALAAAVVLTLSLLAQSAEAVGQLAEYVFFGALVIWLEVLAVGQRRRRLDPSHQARTRRS
jgi:predicted ferric reductase